MTLLLADADVRAVLEWRPAVAAMCVRAALERGTGTQAAIPVEVVLK
jgi:hypothetical protein